jgi:hypothetical protein
MKLVEFERGWGPERERERERDCQVLENIKHERRKERSKT